ncbi:MAG: tyrosine-type recombinase/integrase, partial [Isosphaeraceae bacterium]
RCSGTGRYAPGYVPNWSPNQLRHAAATEIRAKYGIEGAQVILGHSQVTTSQIYAEVNVERGREIAKLVG